MISFRRLYAVIACVVLAVLLPSCFGTQGSTYAINAVFNNGQGLFPGADVDVLGVPIGTVTNVRNVGSGVVVSMSIPDTSHLASGVNATLVTPQILGEPNIDLFPGYSGGATLSPDATIPETRTSVPISINALLKQLQSFLGSINGADAGQLIKNLSADFNGQGAALNSLIQGAAGTLQVLSDKGDELGQTEGNLAQLTSTLDNHLSSIQNLIVTYDAVSSVIAANRTQLDEAITQLSDASSQVASLLTQNLQPLQDDVSAITSTGRTLDRNVDSLDQTISSTVALFAGAQRSFDPADSWINLNLQTPASTSSALVEGLVRDRLSGVCRRILANHSSGLSATQATSLQQCGNPDSGYFDALFSALPAALGGASSSGSAASSFSQGLSEIPGLAASEQDMLTQLSGIS